MQSPLLGLVTIALALSAQPSARAAGVARFAGAARSAHHLYVTTFDRDPALSLHPQSSGRQAGSHDRGVLRTDRGWLPLGTTGDVLYAGRWAQRLHHRRVPGERDARRPATPAAAPAWLVRMDRRRARGRQRSYSYVGASAYASGLAPGRGEPFRLPRQGVFVYSPSQRGRVYPSASHQTQRRLEYDRRRSGRHALCVRRLRVSSTASVTFTVTRTASRRCCAASPAPRSEPRTGRR